MKRKMFKRLMAASLATVMTMSMAGCGSKDEASAPSNDPAPATDDSAAADTSTPAEDEAPAEEEEVSKYTVLKDENGNVYDLGGMEIVIRDWWSNYDPDAEPKDDYEEALFEYRDWIQETYNFKIHQEAISDWGSTPQDFVDYVTTGDDGNNYVFILRADAITTGAANQGLMYDLNTLDCLDFSTPKFQNNKIHELYTFGDKTYCMYAGKPEPRCGVYFNKRLLKEANIDPDSLYDLQASGEWTWDKWTELMDQVQRDTDNDGVIDVYGMDSNTGYITQVVVNSNGGHFIGKDASGNFTYELESPETQEALKWWVDVLSKYQCAHPEDAQWDYYKEAFLNGQYVFMPEDGYCGTAGNWLPDMSDDFGFVMFPKGYSMSDYTSDWSNNNPVAIPACYDADKAWKLAFAWNLYTDDVPGYENYEGWKTNYYAGFRDTRAVDETAQMMTEKGYITYVGVVPNVNIGPDFAWNIYAGCDVSAATEAIRDTWKAYIDEANGAN